MLSLVGLSLVLFVPGAPFPDEIDIVRVDGAKPRMNLLLDSSCSMGFVSQRTNCTWFADQYNRGNTTLDLNEQMRAVLLGCAENRDGVLDRWYKFVDFSIRDFRGLRASYGSSLDDLRTAVVGIPARGGTPLTRVLRDGGQTMNSYSTDSNTETCQAYYQLLLSDGNPNGGASTFSQECTSPVESLRVDSNTPWLGSEYLYDRHPDLLCNVTGQQQIRTFTLGFGPPGWFDPIFLQQTALLGGGEYFYAQSVPELVGAFDSIIGTVANNKESLIQISIGQDNFFSANRSYAVNFQTEFIGPWKGNVRRLCIFPPRSSAGVYDTSVRTCLLRSDDGSVLLTNPDAVDLWTGQPVNETTVGGAGEVIRSSLGRSPSSPYWTKRNILTWRAGQDGWVPVRPDTWTSFDAHVSGCEYYKLINYLHGYSYDADCSTGHPVAIGDWPMADPIHGAPVELRYGECESPTGAMIEGNCYVVIATNNGMLHFIDAGNGEERSAIIPAELWRPSAVANNFLGELRDQPSSKYTHRYYMDGVMKLLHGDVDADGIIDAGEVAWLFFSLGRGGRAYYALDVSSMSDGVVDSGTPVYPLLPTSGTALEDLGETWAAPVFARMPVSSTTKVAAFIPSGHYARFDFTERTAELEDQIAFLDNTITGETRVVSCAGAGGLADFNGYGVAGLCEDFYTSGCAGTVDSPCYDGLGLPLDEVTRPLTFTDGLNQPSGMRLFFSEFDLGPNDQLQLLDDQGNLVQTYTGTQLAGRWTDWVYRPGLSLRLVTDGQDSGHRGYRIQSLEWEVGFSFALLEPSSLPAPVLGVDHKPALYVFDTAAWNGASPQAFAGTSSDQGIILKVAKDCSELGARCIDERTDPSLQHLVCPITGAPAPYMEDGRLTAMYFGDECGQLFKLYTPDGGATWTARRLLNLNNGELSVSKDHRKIFTRIDIVESFCPGREVVGVYFGTGNVQRPLASDELQLARATDGREVIGVLWDDGNLPEDLTQQDLADASTVDSIDPVAEYGRGKYGWLLRLLNQERLLRDPIVVDGIAYFKTFEADISSGGACRLSAGFDRVYAVDNCSAEAESESKLRSERVAWSGNTVIATGLTLLAPKNGIPIVVHGDITSVQNAAIGQTKAPRPGIFLWRDLP